MWTSVSGWWSIVTWANERH